MEPATGAAAHATRPWPRQGVPAALCEALATRSAPVPAPYVLTLRGVQARRAPPAPARRCARSSWASAECRQCPAQRLHPGADTRLHRAEWQIEALGELGLRITLVKCRFDQQPLLWRQRAEGVGDHPSLLARRGVTLRIRIRRWIGGLLGPL